MIYGIKGSFSKKGNIIPDPELKDTEDIPYNTPFEDYMKKEVLPFAPDTWIDESVIDDKYALCDRKVGVVGTNISFNKYFYKYEMPRDPKIIAKEIEHFEDFPRSGWKMSRKLKFIGSKNKLEKILNLFFMQTC